MSKQMGWGVGARWLLALTVIVLVGRGIVLFLNHNYNVAAEANGLYGLLEVADGNLLYPPRTQQPYGIYLYTPLQAYSLGKILAALHLEEVRTRVLFVRFTSLLALLAAIGLIGRSWIKRGRVEPFAFATALILALPKFADYATSSRNDMLSLLFEVSALLLFARWIRKGDGRSYYGFIAACALSLWTRQMGICIFGSAMLWLLLQRRYRKVFQTVAIYGAVNAVFFLVLFYITNGAMVDHIFLSNIRGFRPFNDHFVDIPLITFIFGYLVYFALIGGGLRIQIRRGLDEESSFLATSLALSFAICGFLFLRAGGDTNYFFLSLFIGIYFASLAIAAIRQSTAVIQRRAFIALALQLLFVQTVYVYKIYSSYQTGFLNYEEIAEKIKSEVPGLGLVTGRFSQGMGILLRGWAAHGPDITNAGLIARNSHRSQRWLLYDAHEGLDSGRITSVLIADPNCANRGWMQKDWLKYFEGYEQIAPWMCVYRNTRTPRPDSRVGVLLKQ